MITPHAVIYTRLGLSPILGTLVTCLFLVTLANAFNFLDGIDGQVGLLTIITVLGVGVSDDSLWAYGLITASAVLGFMYHNFPPARIYLGEVGSSFLGFTIGAFATLLPISTSKWSTFMAINFFCCLAFVDLIRVIYTRLKRGQAPWAADKGHIHHILAALGFNRFSSLLFTGFIALFASTAGYALQMKIAGDAKVVIMLLASAALCAIYFGVLHFEKQMGKRSSLFGRQLITKYIHFDNRPLGDLRKHCALVIDLLPYFSEIQSRGIGVVDRFAAEFGAFVGQQKNVHSVRMVGSYSVALIYDESFRDQTSAHWRVNLYTQLQDFFLRHKAVRALLKTPEGVTFYENLLDPEIKSLLDLSVEIGVEALPERQVG